MPTYTFTCTCGWQGDVRTTFSNDNVRCPSCVATASRESVYSVNFGGFAGTPRDERDWSHDYKNFTEAGAELGYKKERLEEGMQKQIEPPPLWQTAKKTARTLMAKGVNDLNDLS